MPEVIKDATSMQRVLCVLTDGRPHSIPEIGRLAHCQDNTAVKNIKYLRDAGHNIEKDRVKNPDGSDYYLYRLCEWGPAIGTQPAPEVRPEPKVRLSCPNCHADAQQFASAIRGTQRKKCDLCGTEYTKQTALRWPGTPCRECGRPTNGTYCPKCHNPNN